MIQFLTIAPKMLLLLLAVFGFVQGTDDLYDYFAQNKHLTAEQARILASVARKLLGHGRYSSPPVDRSKTWEQVLDELKTNLNCESIKIEIHHTLKQEKVSIMATGKHGLLHSNTLYPGEEFDLEAVKQRIPGFTYEGNDDFGDFDRWTEYRFTLTTWEEVLAELQKNLNCNFIKIEVHPDVDPNPVAISASGTGGFSHQNTGYPGGEFDLKAVKQRIPQYTYQGKTDFDGWTEYRFRIEFQTPPASQE